MEDVLPSIPGFFAGANVFITGGLGFVGKVLVEKLLRSCPQIQNIYLLVRPKKGMMPKDRMNKMISCELFGLLRETQPDCFAKLKTITGDLKEINLGISEEDLTFIKDNVDVVFNCGANVNFDDTFREAMFTNCRSVRELINIAKEMKHLKAVVHVSTTYANSQVRNMEEKVYPAVFDWRTCIKLAEAEDQTLIQSFSLKIYEALPNSYVFSKQLAEKLIQDTASDLPINIVRLPIVLNTIKEPIPGWSDSFGTIFGPFTLSGKGLVHSGYVTDAKIELMPLDLGIKLITVAAVRVGTSQNRKYLSVPQVYNSSSNLEKSITSRDLVYLTKKLQHERPSENVVWYPSGFLSSNQTLTFFVGFFVTIIPSIILENVLTVLGYKPRLIKIMILLKRSLMLTNFYVTSEWNFNNKNMLNLLKHISKEDIDDFNYSFDEVDIDDYISICQIGTKRYLLKEKDENIPKAKAHLLRMYYLHLFCKFGFYAWVSFYVLRYLSPNIIGRYF